MYVYGEVNNIDLFIYYRQDGQGNTPLHLALSQEKASNCTQILCDKKISAYNWSLQDAFGRTAVHWICAKGYSGLLTEITNIDVDIVTNDNGNKTGLILGLGDDDEEEEKKADENNNDNNRTNENPHNIFDAFNLQNKSGQTCLHWAVDKKEWYFTFIFCFVCKDKKMWVMIY